MHGKSLQSMRKMSNEPSPPDWMAYAHRLNLPLPHWRLWVVLATQELYRFNGKDIDRVYTISSSRLGPGNEQDSFKTPTGLHRVAAYIGQDAPIGTVFSGREPTGHVLPAANWHGRDPADLILSRILWLEGLEYSNRGGRVDTYRRYIYLHGTNHEHRLGQPSSAGCIRMANQAIVELFSDVHQQPCWCLIQPE